MKLVVEFYRTRAEDDAHAIVARETIDAADAEAAIGIARQMLATLSMPQQPDMLAILTERGKLIHSVRLDGDEGDNRPVHGP